jgi:integrase
LRPPDFEYRAGVCFDFFTRLPKTLISAGFGLFPNLWERFSFLRRAAMIEALLAAYLLEHDLAEATVAHYRLVLTGFERWRGHPLTPGDFTDSAVNSYLGWLKQRRSPFTVKQRRTSLLVLWKAACELGLVSARPGRVRLIRTPDRVIETWLPSDIGRMLQHAAGLRGQMASAAVPKSLFWSLWVLLAYDTGLRTSDLFSLECQDVLNLQGRLTIVQRKTKHAVTVHIRPETLDLVRQMAELQASRFILPRCWRGNNFSHAVRKFLRGAGLQGSATKMRQTSCTEVDRLRPGAGWVHLGHRTSATTQRWYLNRRRAFDDNPLPPLPDAG